MKAAAIVAFALVFLAWNGTILVGTAYVVGCEWWKPAYNDGQTFETEKACLARVAEIKPRSIMFFDMKCEPIKPGAQS